MDQPTDNLPIQLTAFIGRDQELAEVRALTSGCRLLTLTGAGGVGKTRLALQAASDLVTEYPDGVWWTELAFLSDSALVARAVASSLGLGEAPGQSHIDTLTDHLRPKRLLLVLDNCEHLVQACADLADRLLRACPHVRILATSRQSLGAAGETAWRVPSLPVPHADMVSGLDEIAASAAVRLFVHRARSALPSFVLDDRNANAVAQICRQLDGIPLAIELAAARLPVLTPMEIAARLDDCFRLLVGGSRTTHSRQQTLRATLDWSFSLLSEVERTLFRRLGVFSGGFTLLAAEATCSGASIRRDDVLDVLAALIDKSLVAADTSDSGGARYGLLEPVRQYAWYQLGESAEREATQRHHAEYFLNLAMEAEPFLLGSREQGAWLNRLEREQGNFRAALQWTIHEHEAGTGVRLAAALYRLWYMRGYLAEGRRWLDQLLAEDVGSQLAAKARALRGAGLLAYAEADYAAARGYTEHALQLARELKDVGLVAAALNNLGIILTDVAEYTAARACCEEALALARAQGDESTAAILLNNLGHLAVCQSDYASAAPFLEECLAIAQERGNKELMAWAIGNLGNAAYYRGSFAAAGSAYKRSLALGCEAGEKRVIAERLEELAWVAGQRAQVAQAVRLFGAAQALRQAIGAPMPPANRAEYERSVARARARLGDSAFAELWERGRALPRERAIDEAMAVETADAEPEEPSTLLTQREWQVVSLVAQGASNREIAAALVVSVRTAEAHITHLLNKLDLRSRAQLAVWAVEHGVRGSAARPE